MLLTKFLKKIVNSLLGGPFGFDLKRMGKAFEVLSQQKMVARICAFLSTNIKQNRLLWPISSR
jgi:hypothetical protein